MGVAFGVGMTLGWVKAFLRELVSLWETWETHRCYVYMCTGMHTHARTHMHSTLFSVSPLPPGAHVNTQHSPVWICTCSQPLSHTSAVHNILRPRQPGKSLCKYMITMRSWCEFRPSKWNGNYPLRNDVTLRIITMFCVIFFFLDLWGC